MAKSEKSIKQVEIASKTNYENKEPDELVIKEIMIQKSVSREKAIEILKNPTQK
jgi:hypothetical protein